MHSAKELSGEMLQGRRLEDQGEFLQAKAVYERVQKQATKEIGQHSRKFSIPFGSIVTGILIASTNLIGGALIGAGIWYAGARAADSLCCFDLQDVAQRAEMGIDRCVDAVQSRA